jgi:hypothetical protein
VESIDLELENNEASDLAPCTSKEVLKANNWDVAYFIFLDEGHLDEAVGLLGHKKGKKLTDPNGWEHRHVPIDCGDDSGKTDDSEASATHGEFTYVIASHYGKKRGPLQVERQWIARFRQDDVVSAGENGGVQMHVMRDKFKLHRAVNDALAASDIELIRPSKEMQKAFVNSARKAGNKKGKKWAKRLKKGDYAFNIEGAAYRPNGNLLLGLRFPVAATGAPIFVEVAGVPEWFEGKKFPTVEGVWTLDGPGSAEEPVGFRAMTYRGNNEYDCILGNLDAVDKKSMLIDNYPEGAGALSQHWRFKLTDRSKNKVAKAKHVKTMGGGEQRIEGIAAGPNGRTLYVSDEDGRVGMRFFRVS